MSGFLLDYSAPDAGGSNAAQIMQTFGPAEANVLNDLARNFAVCDQWYSSVPTQTWPNRGFVHAGSSDGHINNDNYEPYDIPTIFNVLESQGKSWGTAACSIGDDDQSLQTPLNSLQHSLIAAAARQHTATPTDQATVMQSAVRAKSLQTYEAALNFLHPDAPK
jgi:phospholipase C